MSTDSIFDYIRIDNPGIIEELFEEIESSSDFYKSREKSEKIDVITDPVIINELIEKGLSSRLR